MQGRRISLPALAALAHDMYGRESQLVAKGLTSFVPGLRFLESLSDSAEDLEEYRRIHILSSMDHIGGNSEFMAWLAKARREAAERYQRTQLHEDSQLTALDRKIFRLQAQDRESFRRMLRPIKEETQRRWRDEVVRFSSELSDSMERDSKSRMALYRAVMGQADARTGLGLNKRLSTSRQPLYCKPIASKWKVCFEIDQVKLAKPDIGPSTDLVTGEVIDIGIEFELWLSVHPFNFDEGAVDTCGTLSFDNLFPIRNRFSAPYASFKSFRELEALIRIHVEMFLLIEPDLEKALNEDAP